MDSETVDMISGILSLIFQVAILCLLTFYYLIQGMTLGEYAICVMVWFVWTSIGNLKVKIEV